MPAPAGRRLLAAVLLVAAVGGCSSPPCPETLEPGTLLSAGPLTSAAALPSAGANYAISYISEDPHGDPVAVTGTVAIPPTPAPDGGWPVISWAHGTTGYAGVCAPSLDFDGGPAHGYLQVVTPTLDHWVAAGYAVVATDYQGLGGPGGAPYLNGSSEAANVIDIVTAARHLEPGLATDFVTIGHSQGGQAALFTAATAADRNPELDLRGAVAIAPGSGFSTISEVVGAVEPAMQPFLPVVVLGAAVADPAVEVETLFAPQFAPFVDGARTGCLDQLRDLDPVPAGQVFGVDADLDVLSEYLARQEPASVRPHVPVLVAQGTTDTTIPPELTDALVEHYCAEDITVDYRRYPGADHRRSIAASLADTESFVADALQGKTPANTCG
ncbi:alpha/beta fold hydrolase [Mycobacterium koreense]|uniref:Uncharacterized protein n=1 Tax=Mycolicibacillus koreensis TaxID=1069220 RepID=A0A7I7SK33_9MYCO|nr:lipase family protein [Mycolicibacillus koreensis]MCV7246697.1 alpha/beta fold hydrolase [Mycolicibacillus koreensis]OSC30306.1 hypothetical protein B8W67_16940 [Mycolicibacillus koreensis]BBY56355.1 lipase [Mycolicibacillus koreensis]